jgi:hypothetical protein
VCRSNQSQSLLEFGTLGELTLAVDDTGFWSVKCEKGVWCAMNIQVLGFLHVASCSIAIAGIVVKLHCLIENDLFHIS